jgi:3-phytase
LFALSRWLRRIRGAMAGATLFATVPLTYETAVPPGGHGELDTPAIWVAPNANRSLLLVTDKTEDYIEVHDPANGSYLGRLGGTGAEPGLLDRPNSVAVGYGLSTISVTVDVLFVVERYNHRVSMFYLPYGLYLGDLGADVLDEPMGIALYWDGAQPQVWITDVGPTPQRVQVFDVVPTPTGFSGTLRRTINAPASATLESIVIDPVSQRVLVCDEGSKSDVMVFDLQGNLLQRFGAGHFTNDPEGLVIFDTGNGAGYLIITDQQSVPMEFEVFDRQDYHWITNFSGPTLGTDGIALVQGPLPNFPSGSFYAVHADDRVHAYDWANIAAATGLCLGSPCWPVDASDPATAASRVAVIPNPFRPHAALQYRLATAATVEVSIYDLRGTRVARLTDGRQPAGQHTLAWDGRDAAGRPLPSGVYFVRLRLGALQQTAKITLLR